MSSNWRNLRVNGVYVSGVLLYRKDPEDEFKLQVAPAKCDNQIIEICRALKQISHFRFENVGDFAVVVRYYLFLLR